MVSPKENTCWNLLCLLLYDYQTGKIRFKLSFSLTEETPLTDIVILLNNSLLLVFLSNPTLPESNILICN